MATYAEQIAAFTADRGVKADRQKAFCAEVTGALKNECYERLGVNLLNRTKDEPTLRSSCAALGPNAGLCLRGAGIAA